MKSIKDRLLKEPFLKLVLLQMPFIKYYSGQLYQRAAIPRFLCEKRYQPFRASIKQGRGIDESDIFPGEKGPLIEFC